MFIHSVDNVATVAVVLVFVVLHCVSKKRTNFGVRFESRKVNKKSKPTWKL